MCKLAYSLLNPTGNRTILSETPVRPDERPGIARALLSLEPEGEQVGFVRWTDELQTGITAELEMCGGEFCGNASMAAAALWCIRRGQCSADLMLRVSGEPEPVRVLIKGCADGIFTGEVRMPEPIEITVLSGKTVGCEGDVPYVRFRGLGHLILGEANRLSDAQAEKTIRRLCCELDLPCLGMLFYSEEDSSMRPLVYVRDADTLYWESTCASGTAAIGYWRRRTACKSFELKQPGGVLKLTFREDKRIWLEGQITLEKDAEITLKRS